VEDEIRDQSAVAAKLAVISQVWRSGRIESVHLGAAAVADASGRLLARAGDPSLSTYLRSAAKPVQLAAMLKAGLERVLPLTGAELALCAASHGGEPGHVELVSRLLSRGGLGEHDLSCGAAWPLDGEAARQLHRSGRQATALHNNCSGKHAAMLLTCRANDWPLASYTAPEHPLQQMITAEVAALAGSAPGVGVDGCGVPTFYLPLYAAARMTAALMERAESEELAHRVIAAMTAHPWFTSGSQRLPYQLMQAVPQLLAKEGAEGFFVVGIPRQRSPWGRAVALAMKVLDGAGEEARGREPGVLAALVSLDVLSKGERELLHARANPPIHNSPGEVVGEVRGVLRLEPAGE
jgi:L-asparaginase II